MYMLWYDATKNTLRHKLEIACEYFERKYRLKPTNAFIHRAQVEEIQDFPLQIHPDGYMLKDCMLIGVD